MGACSLIMYPIGRRRASGSRRLHPLTTDRNLSHPRPHYRHSVASIVMERGTAEKGSYRLPLSAGLPGERGTGGEVRPIDPASSLRAEPPCTASFPAPSPCSHGPRSLTPAAVAPPPGASAPARRRCRSAASTPRGFRSRGFSPAQRHGCGPRSGRWTGGAR